MSRSKWKGPYIKISLVKKLKDKKRIKIYSRNSTVSPDFVGKKVSIHNGKLFLALNLKEKAIGHKLGEFVPTRVKLKHKVKKKKVK